MDKFVIAITRTCGSGATSIGKILAKNLGVEIYDRNILRLASDDSGISEELFARADEDQKQSLLFRASQKVYTGDTGNRSGKGTARSDHADSTGRAVKTEERHEPAAAKAPGTDNGTDHGPGSALRKALVCHQVGKPGHAGGGEYPTNAECSQCFQDG